MQHLGVLADAKLVLARREGRFRYNHLNAIPLTQMYDRWVSQFARVPARAGLDLKAFVERGTPHGEPPMPETPAPGAKGQSAPKKLPTDFRTIRVEVEVKINADRKVVWDAMVNQTTNWWRKDFCTKESRGFHIEPRIGGRMYEDRGDGNGLIWATVIGMDAPKSILFVGYLTAQFGGPAHTMFEFSLEPVDDDATLLRISDTIFGNVNESLAGQMDQGWRQLFEGALKEYVEQGKRA